MRFGGGEIRASFTFYPSDRRALETHTATLAKLGFKVQRTDTFRLLLEMNSELEMFAHTTLRLSREEFEPGSDEMADERFTVRLKKAWLGKLDRVVEEFTRRKIQMERTYVARSLVHAIYDARLLQRFARDFFGAKEK